MTSPVSADQHPKRETTENNCGTSTRVCPVCRGQLIEIRGKLQCSQCHTICETCCEGGRW
jgi:hypothetical protein